MKRATSQSQREEEESRGGGEFSSVPRQVEKEPTGTCQICDKIVSQSLHSTCGSQLYGGLHNSIVIVAYFFMVQADHNPRQGQTAVLGHHAHF